MRNSLALIASDSRALLTTGMLPVDDIRLANLAALIQRRGGQRQLAELLDKAPAQISQWMTKAPNSKTGKPRVMRSDTAREIEERLGLPRGWMDQDHSMHVAAPPGARKNEPWDESEGVPDTHGAMKRIQVYLSAGNGNGVAEGSPEYMTPNLWRAEFM